MKYFDFLSASVLLFGTAALTLLSACVGSSAGEDRKSGSLLVDLPYQAARRDPIAHDVDFSVVITPPYDCHVLKVWLPLPSNDHAQQISNSKLSTFPMKVQPQVNVEPVYGNKFAYFEFLDPRGAQIIRHRFRARVWTLEWSVDPEMVKTVSPWPEPFSRYLQPQTISQQAEFNRVLDEIVPGRSATGQGLQDVMHWIDENLTYDHRNASLAADADHAFEFRRGHCSDYHGLCATMGRELGFPTRITYGVALFPKNSPSHCKLEAFLPPYGWVSYDLSETQKLVKRIQSDQERTAAERERLTLVARQRLHRGFRENSWLLLTRGNNYQLVPKASRPVKVVRTIYAEADGEPLPEPDPANRENREFAWMTVHQYTSDKPFKLPFRDLSTLRSQAAE